MPQSASGLANGPDAGCVLDRIDRAGWQIEPELTQGAAQTVDAGGTGRLPLLTQAMQLITGFAGFRSDRHRHDVVIPSGLSRASASRRSFLLPRRYGPNMLRRQQFDLVTQRIVMVRARDGRCHMPRAAPGWRRLGHEFGELGAIEAVSSDDSAIAVRDGHLETIFCQPTPGFYCFMSDSLFVSWGFVTASLAPGCRKQEESISSFAVRACASDVQHLAPAPGMSSPLLPEHPLHAERRLPER